MQYVFFHGSFVGPNDGWIPQVAKSLRKLNQTVLTPTFPTDNWQKVVQAGENAQITRQHLTSWTNTFKQTVVPKLEKKSCFVGHSLGPLFSLHMIDQFNLRLDSAIFVVPFLRSPQLSEYWQIERANQSFYRTDFNFSKLKQLIPVSYALYSDNDPYIPSKLTLEFCRQLGSHPIQIKGGAHLSMDSGWSDLPLVTELCKTRISAIKYR